MRFKLAVIGAVFLLPVTAQSDSLDEKTVPRVYNMQELGKEAATKRIPILFEFAMAHCEYCKRLEEDYLGAMSTNATTQQQIIIRKVMIDEDRTITDFSGESIEMEAFVKRYRVAVTPTVILVDSNGRTLSRSLIGYHDTGFYGGYLESAIQQATEQIR